MTDGLKAFRNTDFNWAAQLQDVWRDASWDVPDLHKAIRDEFMAKLETMKATRGRNPLGWFILGSGGVGKTHLLGAMRQEAVRQTVGFVLVDMTDVRDFWDVVLQGYLDSLQTVYVRGKFQFQVLLYQFIGRFGRQSAAHNLAILARRKTTALSDDVKRIVGVLRKGHPKEALDFQDSIRALICLNSEDMEIAATGYSWLQGQEIEESLAKALGFSAKRKRAIDIVRSLSWVMSLSGPTVLAFDQLDPIVQQYRHQAQESVHGNSTERGTALAIIEQIGAGLAAVSGVTYNTLAIVSCVENTLTLLKDLLSGAYLDRFEEERKLKRPMTFDIYENVIRGRLAPGYHKAGFVPPYPTWPFSPQAIAGLRHESVREVLKLCEKHRKECLLKGEVTELHNFRTDEKDTTRDPNIAVTSSDAFADLERQFQQYRDEANPQELLEEKQEDERLAPLYRTALECLILEHEAEIPEHVEALVEHEFSGGKTTKPLHARLRIVDHHQDSREDHYCVRALQRRHHGAYQARLKAAMTQSGIDRSLPFRHLLIIRTLECPGGSQTESLTRKFREAGGRFHEPTSDELRTLAALYRLANQHDPLFSDWLQQRRPVSQLGLGKALTPGSRFDGTRTDALPTLPPSGDTSANSDKSTPGVGTRQSLARETETPHAPLTESLDEQRRKEEADSGTLPRQRKPESTPGPPPEPKPSDRSPERPAMTHLAFGREMIGMGELGEPVTIPLPLLAKHAIILGGSGSGKSVTVRRLVEEAALAGIPSIVVDCAQDMCFFDQSWPSPPLGWQEEDPTRAAQLVHHVEQIVWTPGSLSRGNPLSLRPLPDFTGVRDDAEELQDAVAMASDGLRQIVASGNSQKSRLCEGILTKSLRHFALHFPDKGLKKYIEMLKDLPQQAEVGVPNEKKLAQEMAGNLSVACETNPLLGGTGVPLDPAMLFGDDAPRARTRISVISLTKLLSQEATQGFLNQLAMELFSWIKRHPTPPNNRSLRGLLVIDEARDFVPSQRTTQCRESVVRLAAQARKYRLGLLFATQHPRDIDTKIVGNCATHLYGLNNSPASLATLDELMKQKGGSGSDIPKLKAGQFYFHNAEAEWKRPVKIQVPMSLTVSPTNPLEESDILRKGEESRRIIEQSAAG